MKETFEDYLQRLKDRRTEDGYEYTDEDFVQYQEYIRDCWLTNLSVYKCLEFMYFAEEEIQPEQIWNDEKRELIKKAIKEHANIADGGDFKALLLHHNTKLNSSTNAKLWHVCPTIGNILLAAVNFCV